MTLRRILVALMLVILGIGGVMAWQIGPSNIIGMLLYDQRREGDLLVGHRAPDVVLANVDACDEVRLSEFIGGQPLVLIFGSFT